MLLEEGCYYISRNGYFFGAMEKPPKVPFSAECSGFRERNGSDRDWYPNGRTDLLRETGFDLIHKVDLIEDPAVLRGMRKLRVGDSVRTHNFKSGYTYCAYEQREHVIFEQGQARQDNEIGEIQDVYDYDKKSRFMLYIKHPNEKYTNTWPQNSCDLIVSKATIQKRLNDAKETALAAYKADCIAEATHTHLYGDNSLLDTKIPLLGCTLRSLVPSEIPDDPDEKTNQLGKRKLELI